MKGRSWLVFQVLSFLFPVDHTVDIVSYLLFHLKIYHKCFFTSSKLDIDITLLLSIFVWPEISYTMLWEISLYMSNWQLSNFLMLLGLLGQNILQKSQILITILHSQKDSVSIPALCESASPSHHPLHQVIRILTIFPNILSKKLHLVIVLVSC